MSTGARRVSWGKRGDGETKQTDSGDEDGIKCRQTELDATRAAKQLATKSSKFKSVNHPQPPLADLIISVR